MTKKILSCLLAVTLMLCTVAFPTHAAVSTTVDGTAVVSVSKEIARKGYKYVWGGSDPSHGGFDCTGLVYYIYHTRLGYNMTLEQARSKSKLLALGEKVTDKSQLRPGDIVQYTIAHVGIYLGNNTVLHAATGGYGVCMTTLENPKWNRVFAYGIRLTERDENITITFDPNGGSVVMTTQTIKKGGNPRNLPTPVRSGYVFKGWTLDKIDPDYSGTTVTGIVSENSAWGFEKDTTVYALWEKERKPFSITLDDGSVCSQITVTNGSTYGSLPTPTKDGYTFDGWYTQVSGGSQITSSTRVDLSGDQTLYAHWSKADAQDHWDPWSEWSTTPAYASDTRQVETRTVTEQVKVSDGYTEYRYGGYITSDGKHTNWCETYCRKLFGSANLRYSEWSTIRYSENGSGWSCGYCNGNHVHVGHYGSDGRAWWPEYELPDGYYFWEESRTVNDQYEIREVAQYRYRDWISG